MMARFGGRAVSAILPTYRRIHSVLRAQPGVTRLEGIIKAAPRARARASRDARWNCLGDSCIPAAWAKLAGGCSYRYHYISRIQHFVDAAGSCSTSHLSPRAASPGWSQTIWSPHTSCRKWEKAAPSFYSFTSLSQSGMVFGLGVFISMPVKRWGWQVFLLWSLCRPFGPNTLGSALASCLHCSWFPFMSGISLAAVQKERKRADEANKAKGRFLANMSHEMRTPLNGVIAMADVLRETNLNESQKEIVETLGTSANLLLAQIEDVLDLAKIEAGRVQIERRPFDLAKLLTSTVKVVIPQARYKGLAVNTEVAPDVAGGSRVMVTTCVRCC